MEKLDRIKLYDVCLKPYIDWVEKNWLKLCEVDLVNLEGHLWVHLDFKTSEKRTERWAFLFTKYDNLLKPYSVLTSVNPPFPMNFTDLQAEFDKRVKKLWSKEVIDE